MVNIYFQESSKNYEDEQLIVTLIDFFTGKYNPTKMSIKFAPYLHKKSANWALNMMLFECFGAH